MLATSPMFGETAIITLYLLLYLAHYHRNRLPIFVSGAVPP
jgi:hypothetical protein